MDYVDKHKRLERLTKIEHWLFQNSKAGLTVEQLAEKCQVSTRTIYRDLADLQSMQELPLCKEGKRWYVMKEEIYLPPIRFKLREAMILFLAARLMLSYTNRYDPNMESCFVKLNSVVTSPLREQIQNTLDWMRSLPIDEDYLHTSELIAKAWMQRHCIEVKYQALGDKKATARTIDPYYFQPDLAGHSAYVIAYCHRTKGVRTFKVRRITEVQETGKSYEIPPDFDANEHLASAWGIMSGIEVETIKLKFSNPDIVRIQEEAIWHPSQVTKRQPDGSLIMTLKVSISPELLGWILRWGEYVEVLEPEELRQDVIESAKAMLDVYGEE